MIRPRRPPHLSHIEQRKMRQGHPLMNCLTGDLNMPISQADIWEERSHQFTKAI